MLWLAVEAPAREQRCLFWHGCSGLARYGRVAAVGSAPHVALCRADGLCGSEPHRGPDLLDAEHGPCGRPAGTRCAAWRQKRSGQSREAGLSDRFQGQILAVQRDKARGAAAAGTRLGVGPIPGYDILGCHEVGYRAAGGSKRQP